MSLRFLDAESENFLLTFKKHPKKLPSLGGRGLRRELSRTMKGRGMVRRAHHDHPEHVEGAPPPFSSPVEGGGD